MSWGGGALLSQTFLVSKRTTFFSMNTNIMQNILLSKPEVTRGGLVKSLLRPVCCLIVNGWFE